MRFPDLASATLEAVGDPIAFYRDGKKLFELPGVYRNEQQLKRSKSKTLRVIDCDVVVVPYSALVRPGDEVHTGVSKHRIAGKPKRDGSGGMIVRLESADVEGSKKAGLFDR